MRQAGFFDADERLRRLSDLGDQLEAYGATVDFEMFRAELETALAYSDGTKGGRPPYDAVMMFKILVIQAQNNLSDDRAEFLINDRLSFMRFLGLGLSDKVPDAKTIWAFRERLTQAGAIEALFSRFDRAIREAGYIPMSGQIVDASLVAAPKQRNSAAEKAEIKAGRIPQEWKDKPAKLAQKDRDARWTLVFGKARERQDGTRHADIAIPVFGYKSHASIDRRHGFIRRWAVTDAAAHDGRMLRRGLLDKSNTGPTVWADSAYRSRANEAFIERHGFKSQVHHRKPRGRPMPPHIRRGNATRSKVRARIEHVFAHQKGPMSLVIRTIGIVRAKVKIGLANLTYNINRLVFLERRFGGA
jgi:IS5 family transposase